ncbi:MAG: ABC transporter substrate-binding protein [Amphritea sp.]
MSDELKNLSKEVTRGRMSRRDFLNRASALGLALPFASTLLSQSVMAATPNKGGHLILGLVGGSATDSLDPALNTSHVAFNFCYCWGETLVEISPTDGSVVPHLAESFEAEPGAKVWRFNIRKGVTFHNGKEMTADDVVKTLQRHSGEDTKSGALGIMRGIEKIEAEGKHQVIVTLKSGNADLPYLMSDYHLMIQPNGGMDKPDAGVGTGPYQVEVAEHGVRYLGKKYAGYWNDNVGHADSVEVLVLNDQTARMSALQSGRVHMINQVDPKTAKLLARMPKINIENTSGRGHYTFIMHCDKAPFDNNHLRLALKDAIDREEMVKRILHGYGSVGNDFPINQAYDLFPSEIEQRVYDPDKAAHHYKKSGHSGPVVLRVSDAAFSGAVDAAVLYQQQAAKAGIKIEVKREPSDGYWSNVWNAKPFCASYWSGRPTQDQMYSVAYKSDADWNDTKWARPKFDELLIQARTELDPGRRGAIYQDMAQMVNTDGGAIIPMFNDFIDGISTQVQGYVKDPGAGLSNGHALIRCWLA